MAEPFLSGHAREILEETKRIGAAAPHEKTHSMLQDGIPCLAATWVGFVQEVGLCQGHVSQPLGSASCRR